MSVDEKRKILEEMYSHARWKFPDVLEISAEDLMRRLEFEDLVLIDVRQEVEQSISMIPGAISAQQFEQDWAQYSGRTLVPYCTIGGRSGVYSQKLQAQGWRVLNFKGLILAWTLAGGELECSAGPTNKVHTNSAKFDLLGDEYEAVW